MRKSIKKLTAITLAGMMVLPMLTACGESEQKEEAKSFTLFTWEGMFPQEILDGFEEETGITINYANFDYDETMLAKLETAKGGDYDLVIADDYIIETVIAEGLSQKLDTSKLEYKDSINPIYQGQFYDPADEYTVPYGAGVMTIAYNSAATDVEIKSYEDLWDAGLADSIGVIGNYRVVNGMALKRLGESYNTNDVATIERAGELMLDLAPNIRLIKDDNIQDDLLSGEISAAIMYTSQVTIAELSDPNVVSVFPEEGIGFGIMASFIPSQAPNAEGAYEFLNYIMKPENAAKCTEWVGYYSTNKDADALISEEYRDFLTLPDSIDASKAEMVGNISAEADEAHNKAWTEFKTACGG